MVSTVLHIDDLTERQFKEISLLVKSMAGINLGIGKMELVKSRLNKRLRELGMRNYKEYIEYLKTIADEDEFILMLDAISTNLTSFFREADHFEYLANNILKQKVASASQTGHKIRMWSAGCSSGEEPYTLGIVINEKIPNLKAWDVKILATDLSTKVLKKAKEGIYDEDRIKTIPAMMRSRYLTCIKKKKPRIYRVNSKLTSLVHFARLNLMEQWPMKGPFDVIFCRNVMIYFDKETQETLINRYYDLLGPGGTLFTGHSESLAGVKHQFNYIKATVYEKR
ncbi:protein-glutamate O-methyltransferase [bacterium]|nr:protein-glutamate O-methyltransferase [bacterium]